MVLMGLLALMVKKVIQDYKACKAMTVLLEQTELMEQMEQMHEVFKAQILSRRPDVSELVFDARVVIGKEAVENNHLSNILGRFLDYLCTVCCTKVASSLQTAVPSVYKRR